ncbi:MAG: HAD family phosphatase [Ruminococcaceae bacterium]|nr:HAD family phosphatase [Oscillospiraceae bacterium]
MVKMVCFDVDNTLLPRDAVRLSPAVIDMIKFLFSKGILVTVASGRPFCDIVRLFSDVINDIIIIAYDGSLVVYKNKVIADFSIEKDLAYAFVDGVKNNTKYDIAVYGAGNVYVSSDCDENCSPVVAMKKAGTMDNRVTRVDDFHKIDDSFFKLSVFYKMDGFVYDFEPFTSEWTDYLHNVYTKNGWCEFISKNADKGSCLNIICEKFSVDMDNVMAFGDGANDIGMLKSAGYSYAVSGSSTEVMSAADYVTDDVVKSVISFFGK